MSANEREIQELLWKQQITDVLTKQFLYVDDQKWDLLRAEIFAEGELTADNGEGPKATTAEEIVRGWESNLTGLDAVHHQVASYLITFKGANTAHALTLGSASHYKASATHGRTRTFIGTYEFEMVLEGYRGWRIKGLKFSLKYLDGNLGLD